MVTMVSSVLSCRCSPRARSAEVACVRMPSALPYLDESSFNGCAKNHTGTYVLTVVVHNLC